MRRATDAPLDISGAIVRALDAVVQRDWDNVIKHLEDAIRQVRQVQDTPTAR